MSESPTIIRNAALEEAAAHCDVLGDAEFEKLAKKGNLGIAKLAQRHYTACAEKIRSLKGTENT